MRPRTLAALKRAKPEKLCGADINRMINAEVGDLADLQFGWDGHTAFPIRPDAHSFIINEIGAGFENVQSPVPALSLNKDGSVLLEFWYGHRILELTVLTDRIVLTKQIHEDGQTTTEYIARNLEDAVYAIESAIEWLTCDPSSPSKR